MREPGGETIRWELSMPLDVESLMVGFLGGGVWTEAMPGVGVKLSFKQ